MNQQKTGSFIAQLRHEHKWTQEQLAQKLSVSNKTVSRWERGNYMPDLSMLQELAALLGVSVDELLSGERLSEMESLTPNAEKIPAGALSDENSFDLQDKIAYYKAKWLREHRLSIFLCLLLALAAIIFAININILFLPLIIISALFVYMFWRNKMMIYVEHRAYKESSYEQKP